MYATVEPECVDTLYLEQLPDAELIRRLKLGSDDALGVLLRRHSEALYRFCCHLMPSREDAEDICQESMARAITRVDSLQSGSAFRGWLFSIARNLSVDTYRSRKRICPLPDEDLTPLPLYHDSPHESVELYEEHQTVSQALQKLAKSHQQVLVLREVEGMSYADIARHLDVSQSAVETLLFRARRRLREEYGKSTVPVPAFGFLGLSLSHLKCLFARFGTPFAGGVPITAKVVATALIVGGAAVSAPRVLPSFSASAARPSSSPMLATHHITVASQSTSAAKVARVQGFRSRKVAKTPHSPVMRSVSFVAGKSSPHTPRNSHSRSSRHPRSLAPKGAHGKRAHVLGGISGTFKRHPAPIAGVHAVGKTYSKSGMVFSTNPPDGHRKSTVTGQSGSSAVPSKGVPPGGGNGSGVSGSASGKNNSSVSASASASVASNQAPKRHDGSVPSTQSGKSPKPPKSGQPGKSSSSSGNATTASPLPKSTPSHGSGANGQRTLPTPVPVPTKVGVGSGNPTPGNTQATVGGVQGQVQATATQTTGHVQGAVGGVQAKATSTVGPVSGQGKNTVGSATATVGAVAGQGQSTGNTVKPSAPKVPTPVVPKPTVPPAPRATVPPLPAPTVPPVPKTKAPALPKPTPPLPHP